MSNTQRRGNLYFNITFLALLGIVYLVNVNSGFSIQGFMKGEGKARIAYERLKEKYSAKLPYPGVHLLAHDAGEMAYRELGVTGFHICDDAFGYGCYHGLLIAMINNLGPKRGILIAQEGCQKLKAEGMIRSCIHGIGHGLTHWVGYQLTEALRECDRVREVYQLNCFEGVFHEHLIGFDRDKIRNPVFKLDEPMYPCSQVERRYLIACYSQQPEILLGKLHYSIGSVAGWCEYLQENIFIEHCLRGLGVRIGQSTIPHPFDTISKCASITSTSGNDRCLQGAVEEYIFEKQPRELALILCSAISTHARQKECQDLIAGLSRIYP